MCVHAKCGAELQKEIYITVADILNHSARCQCPVSAPPPRYPRPCSEEQAYWPWACVCWGHTGRCWPSGLALHGLSVLPTDDAF